MTRVLRLWGAWLAAGLLALAAHAGPPPPAVQAEIDALLVALQDSGCQFERNGSWYSGAEARAHLAGKRAYLERRSAIATAEDFIALAAAESSMSGKPYRVRCPGAEPVDSRAWLQRRLNALRQPR